MPTDCSCFNALINVLTTYRREDPIDKSSIHVNSGGIVVFGKNLDVCASENCRFTLDNYVRLFNDSIDISPYSEDADELTVEYANSEVMTPLYKIVISFALQILDDKIPIEDRTCLTTCKHNSQVDLSVLVGCVSPNALLDAAVSQVYDDVYESPCDGSRFSTFCTLRLVRHSSIPSRFRRSQDSMADSIIERTNVDAVYSAAILAQSIEDSGVDEPNTLATFSGMPKQFCTMFINCIMPTITDVVVPSAYTEQLDVALQYYTQHFLRSYPR